MLSEAKHLGLFRWWIGPNLIRASSLRSSARRFCGMDCRALLFPGSLQVAASRRRKSRAAIAGRMPASLPSVHGRTVGKPRSLLAQCAGMDARAPRPRGCLFFGYFLLGKQKKVGGRQGRRSNSQGREPVFAKRTDNTKDKIKMDPGLRRDDGGRAFAE